jgi:hypothetical protein
MENLDLNKRKKINQAINFVEELSWLLSKKNVDIKDIPSLLRSLLDSNSSLQVNKKYESPNPNKNYLIGVLPNLFTDQELFDTTNDLLTFANDVLQMNISRSAKRSRFEYIGLIICEIVNLNDDNLSKVVQALAKLTENKDNLTRFKEAKRKANFSWNEAIQKLSEM